MKNGTLYFLDGTLTDEDTSLIRRKFLFINRIDTSKAVSSVRPPAYAYTFFSRESGWGGPLSFDLSKFDISQCTSIDRLFAETEIVGPLDLTHFDLSNITSLNSLFYLCNVSSVNVSNWDTSHITDMGGIFQNTTSLKTVDLSSWDTSKATNMGAMFEESEIENVDVSKFNTSNVTNMSEMFTWAHKLKNIDISNFDMSKVDGGTEMFERDEALESITLGPKNKFVDDDVVTTPNNEPTWYNVGNGTKENPEGNLQFASDDRTGKSVDKYYDGSGKYGVETFVTNEPSLSKTADVNIPSNLGDKIVKDVTGDVGTTVKVKVPNVDGHTPDKATVDATVNIDGTITTTETVTYSPNNVKADVTIPSNLGNVIVPNVTGKIEDKVNVKVPIKDGYTVDKLTVSATVNPDKTITTDEKVTYTGDDVTSSVTIPSNLGDVVVPDVTGKVGDIVDVKVPTKAGYTADKDVVPVTVNPDKTITTDEKVTYNKKSSGNDNTNTGTHNDSKEPLNIEKVNQTVSTYSDQPDVELYSLNNQTMSVVSNRELGHGTDWKNDEKVMIGDTLYYRVATNEWVKASHVYVYKTTVRTYVDSNKQLFKAEDNLVGNRELSAGSNWLSDRIAYLGDTGTKCYRVATNEFVKADDVYEYLNEPQEVNIPGSTTVYGDRGELNRTLASSTKKHGNLVVNMKLNGAVYRMIKVGYNDFVKFDDLK